MMCQGCITAIESAAAWSGLTRQYIGHLLHDIHSRYWQILGNNNRGIAQVKAVAPVAR